MHAHWLVTGAGGQLGSIVLQTLYREDETVLGLASPTGPSPTFCHSVRCDITDREKLAETLRTINGLRTIVHTAAITAVGAAHQNPDIAHHVNVLASHHLAELAADLGVRLIAVSTDLVFDGTEAPYSETAPPTPCCTYGRSKTDMERKLLGFPDLLIVRPPLMFGLAPIDRPSTFRRQLEAIRSGQELRLFEDEFRTPISLNDAAAACIQAARSPLTGVLHMGGPERLSRLDMGPIAAKAMSYSDRHIVPVRQADMKFPEPRPADVSLDSGRYQETFSHPAGRPMEEAMADVVLSLGTSSK